MPEYDAHGTHTAMMWADIHNRLDELATMVELKASFAEEAEARSTASVASANLELREMAEKRDHMECDVVAKMSRATDMLNRSEAESYQANARILEQEQSLNQRQAEMQGWYEQLLDSHAQLNAATAQLVEEQEAVRVEEYELSEERCYLEMFHDEVMNSKSRGDEAWYEADMLQHWAAEREAQAEHYEHSAATDLLAAARTRATSSSSSGVAKWCPGSRGGEGRFRRRGGANLHIGLDKGKGYGKGYGKGCGKGCGKGGINIKY